MIGDQLEMFSPGMYAPPGCRDRRPWNGQSPRELTRAFIAFSLSREGMGRLDLDSSHVGDNECEGQLVLPLFPLGRRP